MCQIPKVVPDEVWKPHSPEVLYSQTGFVLMPVGFFLGGVWIYGGDPGLGVLLVPIGAAALFVAVALTARGVSSSAR